MALRSPHSQVERADLYNPTGGEKNDQRTTHDNETIIGEVRRRIDESYVYFQDEREDMASDLRYLAGDQWTDQVRRTREQAGRPMLTINRLRQFLSQVVNPIRQSDMVVKVAPVDDFDDKELAKVYNAILKQIQYRSSADTVYAKAAEHQAGIGVGWFRIRTGYTNNSSFDQEITIEHIPNPLAVYDDPSARKIDRSDAQWRIVTEFMPTQAFRERYPDAAPAGVDAPTDITDAGFFWADADVIRLAEYWRKTPIKKTIAQISSGEVVDITDLDKEMIAELGVVTTREVDDHKVEQYLVSGSQVLEGPTEWPGNEIPIIPVIGTEVPLETKIYTHGILRFARDPQTLYNYYRTATAETIALRPKAPYIATAKMIQRYKSLWDNHNTSNNPYLLYDVDTDAPTAKPYREPPPEMPTALIQEAQIADQDMKATTGIYDSSLGAQSNETSGIAIGRRQDQGDMATYHYQDNLKLSLEHAGRILIDLIPKIYDTERVIRLEGEDNENEEAIPINKVMYGVDGMPVMINDLSKARFDIRVTIGPSNATKRLEQSNALFDFASAFQEARPFIADLVAKYSDWPGAEEIAKRLRNMVPPQALVDPNDPDAPQPPNPMDDPAVQLQLAEGAAKVEKTQADTQKVIVDTRKSDLEADHQQLENAIVAAQTELGWHEKLQPPAPPQQAEPGNEMRSRPTQH